MRPSLRPTFSLHPTVIAMRRLRYARPYGVALPAVLLALGLSACKPTGPGAKEAAPPAAEAADVPAAPTPTVPADSTVTISDPARRLTVSVRYPQLPGGEPTTEAINAAIRDTARAVAARFADFAEAPSPDLPAEMENTSEGETAMFYVNDRVVSGRIEALEMSAGAAHPNHTATAFTFDRRTGNAVALGDLFADGAAYLDTLSSRSRQRLRAQFAEGGIDVDDEMLDGGTAPVAASFRVFTVGADGLHLFFPHYAVGPYALGSHEVVVPWTAIKPMLRPGGVAPGR